MKRSDLADADCGIAQALGVLGDWWTVLIVRDVAGGTTRFDALQRDLGVSRRALTERLNGLVEAGVLEKRPYSQHPPRHDYVLTAKGQGLLPVLIALQDWGDRHVMGDGQLTATADESSAEVHRVHSLVGRPMPEVRLERHDGRPFRGDARWNVFYLSQGLSPRVRRRIRRDGQRFPERRAAPWNRRRTPLAMRTSRHWERRSPASAPSVPTSSRLSWNTPSCRSR